MASPYFPELKIGRPAYLGGGQWILKNLNCVTVLFGKNGSGKSVLLRNSRNQNKRITHYVSPERGGDFSSSINQAETEMTPDGRHNQRQGNYNQAFRSQSVSRLQTVIWKIGAKAGRGGSYEPPITYGDLELYANEVLPNFRVRIDPSQNPPVKLFRAQPQAAEETVDNAQNMSSGEAETIALCLDLLTIGALWAIDEEETRLLLVDEPDMHLHPDLQQQIARFLVKLAERFEIQVIVATHSTTLLSALGHYGGNKVSVIYLQNSTHEQQARAFDDVLQEMTALLGGHALMGPLFGAPLVLVEGDDDYRIWSQVPRNPQSQLLFSVIPCHGQQIGKYAGTLDKILDVLLDSSNKYQGYIIIDNDRGVPTNPPLKRFKYLQLTCRESENLYFTAEVLATMGLPWETASRKLKQHGPNYGNKAEMLTACDDWDRKNDDFKSLMTECAKILDNKNVSWQLRVGQTLAKRKPHGELAEYLGQDILNALWGTAGQ